MSRKRQRIEQPDPEATYVEVATGQRVEGAKLEMLDICGIPYVNPRTEKVELTPPAFVHEDDYDPCPRCTYTGDCEHQDPPPEEW